MLFLFFNYKIIIVLTFKYTRTILNVFLYQNPGLNDISKILIKIWYSKSTNMSLNAKNSAEPYKTLNLNYALIDLQHQIKCSSIHYISNVLWIRCKNEYPFPWQPHFDKDENK